MLTCALAVSGEGDWEYAVSWVQVVEMTSLTTMKAAVGIRGE